MSSLPWRRPGAERNHEKTSYCKHNHEQTRYCKHKHVNMYLVVVVIASFLRWNLMKTDKRKENHEDAQWLSCGKKNDYIICAFLYPPPLKINSIQVFKFMQVYISRRGNNTAYISKIYRPLIPVQQNQNQVQVYRCAL